MVSYMRGFIKSHISPICPSSSWFMKQYKNPSSNNLYGSQVPLSSSKLNSGSCMNVASAAFRPFESFHTNERRSIPIYSPTALRCCSLNLLACPYFLTAALYLWNLTFINGNLSSKSVTLFSYTAYLL